MGGPRSPSSPRRKPTMKSFKRKRSCLGGWSIECPDGDSVHGQGFSSSSNLEVLFAACRLLILGPHCVARQDVARAALASERHLAGGARIAANDVFPIVFGGVGVTQTWPITRADGGGSGRWPANRDTRFTRVRYNPGAMAQHIVVAVARDGLRHYVPGLLGGVFSDPGAAAFVRRVSALTDRGVEAIRQNNFRHLAQAVNEYRDRFDELTHGSFTAPVARDAQRLVRRFGKTSFGWKAAGAGACRSLILVSDDPEKAAAVARFLEGSDWKAGPLKVTRGLLLQRMRAGLHVAFSAGHRVDLIGAADLGQDPRIGVPGRCLACAVEPRTRWVLSFNARGDSESPPLSTSEDASEEVAVHDAA